MGVGRIHSSSCSRDFSSESAGFPNSVFQTTVWINCKMRKVRVSRREFFSLQTMSSRTLCPTLYPISFNLSSVYRSSVEGKGVTVVRVLRFRRLCFVHM